MKQKLSFSGYSVIINIEYCLFFIKTWCCALNENKRLMFYWKISKHSFNHQIPSASFNGETCKFLMLSYQNVNTIIFLVFPDIWPTMVRSTHYEATST